MGRYIDADALLNRLPQDLPYKASVKRVLMQAPTADVAAEIFAEIEGSISLFSFTDEGVDYEWGVHDALVWVDSKIAELKKKYTEGGGINVLTKESEDTADA